MIKYCGSKCKVWQIAPCVWEGLALIVQIGSDLGIWLGFILLEDFPLIVVLLFVCNSPVPPIY